MFIDPNFTVVSIFLHVWYPGAEYHHGWRMTVHYLRDARTKMSSRQSPQLRAVSAQSSRHHHALSSWLTTNAQHSAVLIWSSRHWVQIMVKVRQTILCKGQMVQSWKAEFYFDIPEEYDLSFVWLRCPLSAGWHPGDGAGVPPEAGCTGEGGGGGEAVLLQRQRHHQPPPHPPLLLPRRPAWVTNNVLSLLKTQL